MATHWTQSWGLILSTWPLFLLIYYLQDGYTWNRHMTLTTGGCLFWCSIFLTDRLATLAKEVPEQDWGQVGLASWPAMDYRKMSRYARVALGVFVRRLMKTLAIVVLCYNEKRPSLEAIRQLNDNDQSALFQLFIFVTDLLKRSHFVVRRQVSTLLENVQLILFSHLKVYTRRPLKQLKATCSQHADLQIHLELHRDVCQN